MNRDSEMPMTTYGPHNPHPLSQMRTELVWEGKYDEFGNRREVDVAGLAMPLQKIETIDEPRSRAEAQGSLFDEQKAHRDDFRNRLIWGDNKLAMASLREEFKGAIDFIYIDPPFDVGADFKLRVSLGATKEAVDKDQSLLEFVAYRDTWGKGADSYYSMLHERLALMRELLSEGGAIYVHVDSFVNSAVRLILDEVFGRANFQNEIVWKRQSAKSGAFEGLGQYGRIHEVIYYYTNGPRRVWNQQYTEYDEDYVEGFYKHIEEGTGRKYRLSDLTAAGARRGPSGGSLIVNSVTVRPSSNRHWALGLKEEETIQQAMDRLIAESRIQHTPGNMPQYKRYLDEMPGVMLQDVWTDIRPIPPQSSEREDYATQKPEALLERMVLSSSNESDLVADFFCGAGTLPAVAERLGRRWIGCDLGRFAVHTSRKRIIRMQRELHDRKEQYRSFDIFNLGRYERQWWQQDALKGAEDEHRVVVLKFFRAERLDHAPSPLIHGRKGSAFVHVDGIDSIFMRNEAAEVAKAVRAAGGREVHCLAWDFEMDIRQAVPGIEADLDIRVRLHRIPREIMEKNRTEVPPFFEVAHLEAEPVLKENGDSIGVDIKLTNFLPSLTEVPARELEALEERAIESEFDFIDFWAVDFDWSPNRPFNHHWQDYRTRKDRSLKTLSDAGFVYDKPGKHTACVKVVDVFGCDTSITVEIEL